nr:hypothetical protein [Botrimarina mediterranea]
MAKDFLRGLHVDGRLDQPSSGCASQAVEVEPLARLVLFGQKVGRLTVAEFNLVR